MVHVLAILASLSLVALALPIKEDLTHPSRMILPREAFMVTLDEENKRLLAYDGEHRHMGNYHMDAMHLPVVEEEGEDKIEEHKRDKSEEDKDEDKDKDKDKEDEDVVGPCVPMNDGDFANLPLDSLNKLRDYADEHISPRKRREVLNDPHFDTRGLSANVCSQKGVSHVAYDAEPVCAVLTNSATGDLKNGYIMLTNQVGVSREETVTVTTSSTISVGFSFKATFKVPEIAEVSAGFTFSAEFINRKSSATTVGYQDIDKQTIREISNANMPCSVSLLTDSCTITGKSTLAMIASGWVWFEYEDRIKGKDGSEHYKWAVNMANVLPKDDERSSIVHFKVYGNTNTSGRYKSVGCSDPRTGLEQNVTLTIRDKSEPTATESPPSPTTPTPTAPTPTSRPSSQPHRRSVSPSQVHGQVMPSSATPT